MLCFAFFVFGTVVGSFLNVCIHRLPGGESVVFPASHCPHCHQPKRQHHVCPNCGYYDGRQAIELKQSTDERRSS